MRLAYDVSHIPDNLVVYLHITHSTDHGVLTARAAIQAEFATLDAAVAAEKARILATDGITLEDEHVAPWAMVTVTGRLYQQWSAKAVAFNTQDEMVAFIQSLIKNGYTRW